jgi:hypothetical protein
MVCSILYGLVLSFSGVLVVLMRFTLPTVDTESTKDIFYFITNNSLTSVNKKAARSTSLNNIIFKSVRKLVILLDTMYVGDFCRSSYKINSSSRTIKIAGTSEYTISHATSSLRLYIFRTGFRDWKAYFNIVAVGSRRTCVLCRMFESLLNDISRKPAK